MKAWIAVACVCASSFTPIVTAARANVAHSCNVFDAAFCFPKPWNAVLTLEPGPDFEVYRVSTRADESLFSIYVGMAPQARDGRVTVKNYKVDGVELNLGTFTGASGKRPSTCCCDTRTACGCTSSGPAISKVGKRWLTP